MPPQPIVFDSQPRTYLQPVPQKDNYTSIIIDTRDMSGDKMGIQPYQRNADPSLSQSASMLHSGTASSSQIRSGLQSAHPGLSQSTSGLHSSHPGLSQSAFSLHSGNTSLGQSTTSLQPATLYQSGSPAQNGQTGRTDMLQHKPNYSNVDDEDDVIARVVKPGSSAQPLVNSIREELQRLTHDNNGPVMELA